MPQPRRVLLVMANGPRRCQVRDRLAEQGFTVYATGITDAALTWLERHTPDLVISDCLLPGTRIAVPHLLRHRGTNIHTIGLVAEPLFPDDRLRELLGFDEVMASTAPVAVLTHRILQHSAS